MKKNKISLIITSVYLLISIATIIYANVCNGMFCGLAMLGPILPWPFILEGLIEDSYVLYFSLVLLNTAILYFIGWGLSRILNRPNILTK